MEGINKTPGKERQSYVTEQFFKNYSAAISRLREEYPPRTPSKLEKMADRIEELTDRYGKIILLIAGVIATPVCGDQLGKAIDWVTDNAQKKAAVYQKLKAEDREYAYGYPVELLERIEAAAAEEE